MIKSTVQALEMSLLAKSLGVNHGWLYRLYLLLS